MKEQIESNPAIENFKNWCINRIKNSEEEIARAIESKKNGNIAIGEGMRELREDAGVDLDEISNYIKWPMDLESGKEEWTSELVERYIGAIGEIYLSKNS